MGNENQEMMAVPSVPKIYASSVQRNIYEYYLDSELDNPEEIRELCSLLRSITPDDTLIIRINCLGGQLDLALMIVNAIQDCEGEVVAVMEANCASAATIIFLSCNSWEVKPWSNMMIHNASFGAGGKGHEVESHVYFTLNRNKDVIREFYKDFLTQEEIDDVLSGKDMHFNAQEVIERLEALVEIRNQRQEEDESEELIQEDDQHSQVQESGQGSLFQESQGSVPPE